MKFLANVSQAIAAVAFLSALVAGVWALVLEAKFVIDFLGFTSFLLSLALAPIAAIAIPLYAGFKHGYWLPGIVVLAAIVAGGVSLLFLELSQRLDSDL